MSEYVPSRSGVLVVVLVVALTVSTVGVAAGSGALALSTTTESSSTNTISAETSGVDATGAASSAVAATGDVTVVSAEEEASTSDDYEVPAPDGIQEGDLLIMTIGGTDGEPKSQADDGWTRIDVCGQDNNADTDCPEDGQDLYLQMFYKVATSNEPSQYDVDADHNTVASVVALRGADTDDPIQSVEALPLDDSEDVSTCPSTEGVDGGMLLCGFTHDDRHELTNYGDLTLRTEGFNGDSSTQVATKQLTDGGDTDVHTPDHVDPTGNKDINMAVVVRPADGDGGSDGGSTGGSETIAEGTYHIVNENSGHLLEVNEGTSDGQTLLQDPEDGGDNQDWQVDYLGDGEYRLVAQHSDKVADVESASTADNADIHQWGWHGGDNQRWYIEDTGGGEYVIRSVNSGKVVEVQDGDTSEDANVHQDAEDGGANQEWRFEAVDGSDGGDANEGDDVPEGSWELVAIPDTQNMDDDDTIAYVDAVTDWVVANADQRDIAFVTHEGDMVSDGDDGAELDNIDAAMSDLDGEVPWSPNVGNHDFAVTGDRSSGAALWKDHFGASRFEGRSYFGGASANGRNFYQTFSANGREFLHISLEWEAPGDPDDPNTPIGWAQDVMESNPNKPTIITTHSYLTDEPRQRMEVVEEADGDGTSGQEMWETLVEPNPQVFMVLNGHNHHADDANDGEYHQVSTNDAGEKVYEMLADYQDYSNGGDGWFRRIRFVPGGGTDGQDRIQVYTYSAANDEYQTDDRSQFHFDLDFDSRFSVSGDDGSDDGTESESLGDRLDYGGTDAMTRGDYLESSNGDYRLTFQASDGNLVLRDTDTNEALWAADTADDGGTRVTLQGDGNLVLYTDAGDPVWASDTAGSGANELVLEDDGALVLSDDGSAVWSVNGGSSDGDSDREGVFAIDGDTVEADYQPDFEVAYPNYVYFEYSIDGGDWQYKLMEVESDDHFETTLGGLSEGDEIDYVFTRWEDGEWVWTDVDSYTFQPDE